MDNINNSRAWDWLYALFFALLMLVLHGYQFNTSDQAEHLPQVYKLIDPRLYSHDFFVDAATQHFGIRFYYVYLVYALSFIAPVSLICFVGIICCNAVCVYSIIRITRILSPAERLLPLVTSFVLIAVFYKCTVGGNHFDGSMFLCSSIANAFVFFGLLQFFKRNYIWMAVLCGIAVLFQLLIGLQMFMLLFGVLIILNYKQLDLILCLKMLALFILLSAPMFIPIMVRQAEPGSDEYYKILYEYRNVLHYMPHLFPISDYIKFSLLTGLTLVLIIRDKQLAYRSELLLFYILLLFGLFVYTLSLEVFHINAIGKLQWFKSTVLLDVFNSIIICRALLIAIPEKIKAVMTENALKYLSIIGIVSAVLILTCSVVIPIEKLQGKYQIGNYRKTSLTMMHEWIKSNLPIDALVLTPPDDDAFLCEAQRPTPVCYKAIIHEPFFMMEWYNRFKTIYGVGLENVGSQKAIDVAVELYKTRKFETHIPDLQFQYRIDNIRTCVYLSELGPVIHQEGDHILTKCP